MTTRKQRLFFALCLVLFLSAGSACQESNAQIEGISGPQISRLDTNLLPSEVLGLRVAAEDATASLKDSTRSFADAVGLYSLRTNEVVMATVQVSRLLPEADVDSSQFRRSIVGRIGSSRARETLWGGESVWLTTATKAKVAIWFKGNYVFLLTMRDEFDQPRTLLRELLGVKP